LPNLIDEKKFTGSKRSRIKPLELILNGGVNPETDIVLLWPARLHEKTKGILNFLKPASELLAGSHLKILIAGDGPDRQIIQEWVTQNLPKNVFLLGQKTENEMLDLYSNADVLLLPSLSDPNPLSVIEGLWSSLPLLISKHCGNQIESVREKYNGWIVDPLSPCSIKRAVVDLSNFSKRQLRAYGENSMLIAIENFNSISTTKKFISELMGGEQSHS